ncbi:MAG TPA: DUF2281 domain-containing protein [Longimicrobiales bacterium]
MRKRLWRKLEALPDEQLYEVLDFIEFLESKYAPGRAAPPSGLQRFAERLEDRLRLRSVAPRAMSGTMKLIGTAGRVLDTLADAGQGVLEGWKASTAARRAPDAAPGASAPAPALSTPAAAGKAEAVAPAEAAPADGGPADRMPDVARRSATAGE